MTLLEVRSKIVSVLAKTSLFTEEDMAGINVPAELVDHREDMILAALGSLVEMGMIRRLGDKKAWMLNMPLQAADQQVTIPMSLAVGIADAINTYRDANEMGDPHADPLDIGEADISYLLDILSDILGDGDDMEGES